MSASLGPAGTQRPTLIDLLDRLLAGGVVLVGEITITVADIELVQISLRALIASVDACHRHDDRHDGQR